jgi:hypothetical protein
MDGHHKNRITESQRVLMKSSQALLPLGNTESVACFRHYKESQVGGVRDTPSAA